MVSPSGTSVTIGNLNHDVSLADVSELAGTEGEIISATFTSGFSAKGSKKTATVVFAQRSNAMSFIKKFHHVPFDGTPMDVTLTGEHGQYCR
jgi:hypothetical protein